MLKALTVSLCLAIPMTAFAQDAAPVQQPAPEAVAPPAADLPAQANLTPEGSKLAPEQNGAVEGAKHCGMYGKGCTGKRGGKKLVVIGVVGTVLTAVGVGVAVGFATRNQARRSSGSWQSGPTRDRQLFGSSWALHTSDPERRKAACP